jgi:outer membrane receptor for ferrienterochelin and colicins
MGRRLPAGRLWLFVIVVMLMSAIFPKVSASQTTPPAARQGGQVRGHISDPAGLSVPNAEVTIRNSLSGESRNTKTGDDGAFEFADLAFGPYLVTASSQGLALAPKQVEIKGEANDLSNLRLSLVTAEDQVVVSASRVNELQEQAPTKVISVTKAEIQDTGYERVGDVLGEMPGIVTMGQSYGVSLVGGEQIDGMDSKETAVLLDGLPFVGARGIDEGYIDLNQQDVGKLDNVEVVKGAASALYGTDALGGVINLISHEPTHPLEIDATTSGGSLGEIDTRLGIGGQWKNLTGYLDLEHHQRDGYTLIPDDPTTVGAYENRQDLLAKLRYTFNPRASISFTSSAYTNHDHGMTLTAETDPNDPVNFVNTPTALFSNDSTQTYALVGDFAPTQSTTLQLRGYLSRYDEDSSSNLIENGVEGPDFDPGNLSETYRRADATIGQRWGSRQFIQGGYEWAEDRYAGDNRIVGGNAGQQLSTNDLWVQDRIQPVRNLLLTVGGRYTNNSAFGGHAVPKVGAVYRVNDHFTVRGSFGEGFRAPNLGELYYHLLHLEYGYQVIGNPTLQPETSQSYSAGGTFTAGRYQLSLNLFRNNLKNLIDTSLVCDETSGQDCSGQALVQLLSQYGVPESFDYDTTGAALFTFINQNVDRAYTEGMDIDGRVALTRSLVFSGAYTYLEAVDAITHTWLPYRSRHQGHIKLEYTNPRWGLVTNLRGTFFSKWPNGQSTGIPADDYAYGYQIWNVYASKTIWRGIRAFGAINNLGNSRDPKLAWAEPTFDRPDYGRTLQVGLHYIFPHQEP